MAGLGITLVDFDVICESNINRQLYALESTLGAEGFRCRRTRARHQPRCVVETLGCSLMSTGPALADPNLVVDAIDTLIKAMLIQRPCVGHTRRLLDGAALGWTRCGTWDLCRGRSRPGAAVAPDASGPDRHRARPLRIRAEAVRRACGRARRHREHRCCLRFGGRRWAPSLPTVTGVFGLTGERRAAAASRGAGLIHPLALRGFGPMREAP